VPKGLKVIPETAEKEEDEEVKCEEDGLFGKQSRKGEFAKKTVKFALGSFDEESKMEL